ncbi:MAG: MbnH family di-heme enzyme [Bacteroidota bacterium]
MTRAGRPPPIAWAALIAFASTAPAAFACSAAPSSSQPDGGPEAGIGREEEYRQVLHIPERLEVPSIPEFNPPTPEKIILGRYLFYDARLSGNGTQSCSSCHLQELAFADGQKTPTGSTGDILRRNSPGLANAVYHSTLTWANNGLRVVEDQIQVPIRGDRPVELGVNDANVAEVLARFDTDPLYARLLREAFPSSPSGATVEKLIFALATFCRTLVSADSPYDRILRGDQAALTEGQKRGAALFNGEELECFHCHNGANLTISYRDFNTTEGTVRYPFFNNGLYNLGGDGSYPPYDQGLYDVTLNPADRGRFRPPSLRNVALTAPYMHDGSIATLADVVRHYAAGGRLIESGQLAGDGRLSPLKSGLVAGFQLSEQDLADVVAFLESLTDRTFIENGAFSNPFAP